MVLWVAITTAYLERGPSRKSSTLCDETLKAFGKVDILVNSAGSTSKGAPTLDFLEDAWADIMESNVTAHCARARSSARV